MISETERSVGNIDSCYSQYDSRQKLDGQSLSVFTWYGATIERDDAELSQKNYWLTIKRFSSFFEERKLLVPQVNHKKEDSQMGVSRSANEKMEFCFNWSRFRKLLRQLDEQDVSRDTFTSVASKEGVFS